jgi:septal ring factor EnvC (AmiA/AmiB activator)
VLAADIEEMVGNIVDIDPKAAERLSDLGQSLEGEEARLRWADVDMRQAFNTEKIALAYAVKRSGGHVPRIVDRVDKTRNVMVLLPILLTWFALFEASRNYRSYIEANPEAISKPFLLLWEQGFGGTASVLSPRFSSVALLDAFIILIIILLTFYSHGRRDEREEEIQKMSNIFQTELDNILAEATVALAPDRAGRPAMLARSVERLASRFDNASQELLVRLKAEHDRLASIANRREKEIADFGLFATSMRSGAEESHRLLLDLRQVSTGLQQTLEDLTSEIAASGDQNRSMQNSVASLERLMATDAEREAAMTRHLADAASALSEAADRSIASAETASQAGRVAAEAVQSIAEIAQTLARSQSNLDQALADQTDANAKLADALRSGAGGVSASSRLLADISMGLGELREEFNRIGQLSQEQTITLSRLLSEQTTMASSLSDVAQDLSAASVATSLRQREMNDDAATLMRRLDSLTATLQHLAGDRADATWLQGTQSGASPETGEQENRSRIHWPGRD